MTPNIQRPTEAVLIQQITELQNQISVANTRIQALETPQTDIDSLYQVMFDTSHIAQFLIDPDSGDIIDANLSACMFYGFDKATLLQMQITDINILPSKSVWAAIQEAQNEQQQIFNFRHSLANGSMRDIEMITSPLHAHGKTLLYLIIRDVTQEKNQDTEKKLFWHAFNQSANNIVITDRHGNIEYVNDSFIKSTGYSRDEAIGKNPRMLKSGHTKKREYRNLWQTISSGHDWSGEFHNKKKNGELYWERATISPIMNANNVITHFVAIKEDITDQKRAAEALEKNEYTLRRSQAIAHVGDWTWNIHSNRIQISEEMCRIFGVDPSSTDHELTYLLGKTIHPDDLERVLQTNRRFLDNNEPEGMEFRIVRQDGSVRHVWVQPGASKVDTRGNILILSGIGQDITESKLDKIRLQEAEKFASSTINALTSHIAIIDASGTILSVNNAWNQFAEQNNATLDTIGVGANYIDVLKSVDPKSIDADVASAVLQGIDGIITGITDSFTLEYPCHSPNEQRWFVIRISRFMNQEHMHIVVAHENITKRIQAEKVAQEQHMIGETLRETITELTGSLDTNQVMLRILDNIGRLVPHTAANIMMIEGNVGRITHCRGYDEQIESEQLSAEYPMTMNSFVSMITTQKPFLKNDVQADPHWIKDVGPKIPLRAYLGVPILIQNEVAGFINLDSQHSGAFSDDHVARVQIFAEQAAIAIHNAQLYDGIIQTAIELSKLRRATEVMLTPYSKAQTIYEVGAHVSKAVVSAFEEATARICLVDTKDNKLTLLSGFKSRSEQTILDHYLDETSLVSHAIRTQKTSYVPDLTLHPYHDADLTNTRSEIVIPLLMEDQVIGVIDVQSARIDAFSKSDSRLLHAFAQSATIILENIRLYDESQRHADNMEQTVKQRTKELQRLNDRMSTILNNVSDGIILLDADCRIRNTNLAFDQLFGYAQDELFDQPISLLIDKLSTDQLDEVLESTRKTNLPQRMETMSSSKDKRQFESEFVFAHVKDNAGHIVTTVRDITQFKEIERMKDQFVSMVSHELRTPISSILLSSETISNYYDRLTDEQRQHKIHQISQQALRLTGLVAAILDISRLDSRIDKPTTNTVNVLEALHEVVDELTGQADDQNQQISVEVSNEMFLLIGDHFDLGRIWRNLISNSIKYTPDGGHIRISLYGANNKDLGQLPNLDRFGNQIPADVMSGRYIIGLVEDNGHGIRPQDLDQLFSRFFRGWAASTNIPGTGLGLALVRDLLQLYNGNIVVSSKLTVGTCFCFWIPVNEQEGNNQ